MEEEPALVAGLAQETGGNLAQIATNTTGVATAANQTTEINNLSTIVSNTGKIPSLGQATMSASQPVVIASNQSSIPVAATLQAGSATIGSIANTSFAVTNTGTFATQVTSLPSLPTGANTIGSIANTSFAVTNTGTFATQVTSLPALPTGTNSIGSVTQATAASLNAQVVGNVAAAATDSGNGVKVSGVYNTTLPTYTNGQRADFQTTANGSQQVNLNTLIAGEDLTNNKLVVEQRYSYAPINTATTTVVKSSAGFLHSIIIAGGTAGAITIYDNTSAASPYITNTFTPGSVSSPVALEFDVSFNTGLTIVTASATVITVSYR